MFVVSSELELIFFRGGCRRDHSSHSLVDDRLSSKKLKNFFSSDFSLCIKVWSLMKSHLSFSSIFLTISLDAKMSSQKSLNPPKRLHTYMRWKIEKHARLWRLWTVSVSRYLFISQQSISYLQRREKKTSSVDFFLSWAGLETSEKESRKTPKVWTSSAVLSNYNKKI